MTDKPDLVEQQAERRAAQFAVMPAAPNQDAQLERLAQTYIAALDQRDAEIARLTKERNEMIDERDMCLSEIRELRMQLLSDEGQAREIRDRALEEAAQVARKPELFKHYTAGPIVLSAGIAKAIRALKTGGGNG